MLDLHKDDIEYYAKKVGLEPIWVEACVLTESMGEPYSTRFEPAFRYLYHPRVFAPKLQISVETEEVHQKTSWGLMHVMGAVAREHGFTGHLPQLIEPRMSLLYGCMHLAKFYRKYADIYDAISAYNQGSAKRTNGTLYANQRHVDRFHAHLMKLKGAVDADK
jgi:hypothetical protein